LGEGKAESYPTAQQRAEPTPTQRPTPETQHKHTPPPHLLCPQRVDDGALAHVGVPDEPHADGLLVGPQPRQLAQQGEQGALAKGVGDGGMEGEGGELAREGVEPALGHPGGDLVVGWGGWGGVGVGVGVRVGVDVEVEEDEERMRAKAAAEKNG